jgi:hypothetical protein
MQSKLMALIVLTIIGCIDYLAFGSIFTCAMFCPKNKLNVLFRQKSRRQVLGWMEVVRLEYHSTVHYCTFDQDQLGFDLVECTQNVLPPPSP